MNLITHAFSVAFLIVVIGIIATLDAWIRQLRLEYLAQQERRDEHHRDPEKLEGGVE